MKVFGLLQATILSSLTFALVQGANAQSSASAPQGAEEQPVGLQDIVVTARRTEESLQTTPLAVTALGDAAIERAQVVSVQDVQRVAPSVVISTGSASTSGFAFVSIRGQGNLQPLIANDPAVATYIDGVYIARPSQGLTDLHDLQRLEVLRGPQGTLFGRNTTGGAINILSKDPVDRLEGSLKGEVGSYAYKDVETVLNVPLADGLAARFVYDFHDRNGYGENDRLRRDVGDQKSHFARGKLKYEGNGFDITLSGDYNKITDKGQLAQTAGYNPLLFAGPLAAFAPALAGAIHTSDNWYTTYGGGLIRPTTNPVFATLPADIQARYSRLPFDKLVAYGFAGVINIDLGGHSLKSISAYRYSDSDGLIDLDGSPAPVLSVYGGAHSESYSQELQLSGNVTESLSYILGGYASRETGYEYSRSQIFGGLIRNSFGDAKNTTKGLYAQLYYNLTDTLRAVGGFRYTWDGREVVLHNQQVLGLAPNAPVAGTPFGVNCNLANPDQTPTATQCNQTQSKNFSYPAWNLGLDWQATDDIFVYVATRGAAKAGGFNIRAGSLPAFSPEKVKDVEGGIKASWLDNRLRTNVALFHTWKSNAQVIVNAVAPGVGVTQYTQNNGDTRVWGAEFEVVAAPWAGMEISGNLSLLDGKYKAGSISEVQRITSATALAGCAAAPPASAGGTPRYDCTVDLSGRPITQLPKKQFSIGATQTIPMATGDLILHVAYAYVGKQHFNPVVAADQQTAAVKAAYAQENALGETAGYGLLNGRIAFQLKDPQIELYVYGRNLTAKKYLSRRFSDLYQTGGLGVAVDYAGDPRVVGIGMRYRFGGS
ncbi:TonB-dependent receptor [Sphingobium sp. CFD-1]|uniref:TonB-dependent receptor n=1 Tax=Sphingobium sp. CFD-1 TaxID=2878545 RepID=UPI00214C3D32|nr:TonB-dependent receptor [Sphingobium sp. CFD-1]